MAGEVSFKAYLTKESEDKPEVRRFSLDQNVATSYIYLKEKLRSLFTPLVLSQSFDIFWKDSDGDYVTICTDEELTIALTDSRNEEVIKVYIKNSKAVPIPVNTAQGASHDGVFCDGCENQISGFRYKCLGCQDYDLCASCEASGVHGEHFTLRIPAPLNVRHPFGHRLINKISKAARRAESRCPWTHRDEQNLAADFNTNCTTEERPVPRPYIRRHYNSQRQFPRTPSPFRRFSNTMAAEERPVPRPSPFRRFCSPEAAERRGSNESCADPKECGKACGTSQDKAAASVSITLDPTQSNLVFNTLADFGIDLASFFPAPPAPQPSTSNSNDQTRDEPKKKTPDTNESSAPKISKMSGANEPSAPTETNATDNNKESKRSSLLDEWTVYNPNETQEPTAETSQPIEIDLEMEINSSASSTVGEKEKATSSAGSQPMEVTSKQTKAASTSDGNLYPSLAALPRSKYMDRIGSMDTYTRDLLYQVLLDLRDKLATENSGKKTFTKHVQFQPDLFRDANPKHLKKVVKNLYKNKKIQDGHKFPTKLMKTIEKHNKKGHKHFLKHLKHVKNHQ